MMMMKKSKAAKLYRMLRLGHGVVKGRKRKEEANTNVSPTKLDSHSLPKVKLYLGYPALLLCC